MRLKSIFYAFVFFANCAWGQTLNILPYDGSGVKHYSVDPNKTSGNFLSALRQKRFIVRGNIVFTTSNLQLTEVENEIIDMESLECRALLGRDTAALRKIWLRDFTLDDPQNDLLRGNNPIPYYITLSRLVEKFTVMGSTVLISGKESVKLLNTNGKAEEPFKRNYTHTWIRENFSWRLAAKTYP